VNHFYLFLNWTHLLICNVVSLLRCVTKKVVANIAIIFKNQIDIGKFYERNRNCFKRAGGKSHQKNQQIINIVILIFPSRKSGAGCVFLAKVWSA